MLVRRGSGLRIVLLNFLWGGCRAIGIMCTVYENREHFYNRNVGNNKFLSLTCNSINKRGENAQEGRCCGMRGKSIRRWTDCSWNGWNNSLESSQ